jgi:carbamoyl-phosphate synthase small subunit
MVNANRLKKDLSTTRPKPIEGQLILEDGSRYNGLKIGSPNMEIGEVCFNTSMTGYQEIITDPSYAGQIINFTFPHIGNVGTNLDDNESSKPYAKGIIINCDISDPSNYRSILHLDAWLKKNNVPGICNIDTRLITNRIRSKGAPKGGIIEGPINNKKTASCLKKIKKWKGLNGLDLAIDVSRKDIKIYKTKKSSKLKVVAIDYGIKQNILNCLLDLNLDVILVPAKTSVEKILSYSPNGIFLSNGPGDPKATGKYAIPIIKKLIKSGIPLFGICLGHQLISLALGAKTKKMFQGHRGANHPVKNLETEKVEITSQNHGFEVTEKSIPKDVKITHKSLFDGSVEGIRKGRNIFAVQYHPEASPGPHDSHYLFQEFKKMIKQNA